MEQIFYIVLGALLALIGGFLTQKYQNRLLIIKEDRKLLFEALDILVDLESKFDAFPAARDEINQPLRKLFAVARRIQSGRFLGLAEKLIEFVQKEVKHTKDELIKLIEEVSKEISRPLSAFQRKENAFFKKVAEELRAMREKDLGQEKRKKDNSKP